MTCGVYQIEHVSSGRLYIGSAVSIRRRWGNHRHNLRRGTHHSSKLQRAWNKYGESAFQFTVITACEKHELLATEQRFIDEKHAVKRGFNCNPTAGNWLGRKHRKDSREKIAARKRGIPVGVGHLVTEETREKIGAANRGRIRSAETIVKLKLARVGKKPSLGKKHPPERCAQLKETMLAWWTSLDPEDRARRTSRPPSFTGFRHSDESRLKMSVARQGKPRSDETKAKIKAALQAHFASRKVDLSTQETGK